MKQRLSNIELLRILAMLMICIIHANMISLPRPTNVDLAMLPVQTITRYFIESLGIVGVNIFVLISGWFMIRTRTKSFLAFAFQIITLLGGGVLALAIAGVIELNSECIMNVFMFTRRDWFVKSYIVLMILAPVLNTFIENSTKETQRNVIIGFFLFSSTYGWLGGANRFFLYGYGPLSFIGLYLLGHYAHTTSQEQVTASALSSIFTFNKYTDLVIYFICTTINTALGLFFLHIERNEEYGLVYAYTNPFSIIGALYLLLFFSKTKIKNNKKINILASGSFAVYLLHSNVYIFPQFTKGVRYFYDKQSGLFCILTIFIYLLLVYLVITIIDRPRVWLWNRISTIFNLK